MIFWAVAHVLASSCGPLLGKLRTACVLGLSRPHGLDSALLRTVLPVRQKAFPFCWCELHLPCPLICGSGGLFTCMCQLVLSERLRVICGFLDFCLQSPRLINTLSLNSRWLGFPNSQFFFPQLREITGLLLVMSSCSMGCKFSPISKSGQLEGLPLYFSSPGDCCPVLTVI